MSKVILTQEVRNKMHTYVMSVTTEISGFGKAKWHPGRQAFVVEDIKIFKQEVSGADTEISSQEMANFLFELSQANEDPAEWCVWWHSHADMGVFWSGTDTGTMDEWPNAKHLISIVTNRKEEYKCRYDQYVPFRFKADDVPLEIEVTYNPEIIALEEQAEEILNRIDELKENQVPQEMKDAIEEEVKEKVTKRCQKKNFASGGTNTSTLDWMEGKGDQRDVGAGKRIGFESYPNTHPDYYDYWDGYDDDMAEEAEALVADRMAKIQQKLEDFHSSEFITEKEIPRYAALLAESNDEIELQELLEGHRDLQNKDHIKTIMQALNIKKTTL